MFSDYNEFIFNKFFLTIIYFVIKMSLKKIEEKFKQSINSIFQKIK